MLENQFSDYANLLHNHMPQGGPSLSSYCPWISSLSPLFIDIHFWLMSDTHSYDIQGISIFSISFFFASITSFICSCFDVSKTTFSWQFTLLLGVVVSIDQQDPNWYRLDFHFPLLVLYSTNVTIFSSWFRLCTHNLSLFSTLHFYSFYIPQWHFYMVFQCYLSILHFCYLDIYYVVLHLPSSRFH